MSPQNKDSRGRKSRRPNGPSRRPNGPNEPDAQQQADLRYTRRARNASPEISEGAQTGSKGPTKNLRLGRIRFKFYDHVNQWDRWLQGPPIAPVLDSKRPSSR